MDNDKIKFAIEQATKIIAEVIPAVSVMKTIAEALTAIQNYRDESSYEIQDILIPKDFGTLHIPADKYDFVCSQCKIVLDNNGIVLAELTMDSPVWKGHNYEPEKIAESLRVKINHCSDEEKSYCDKALQYIFSVVLFRIGKKDETIILAFQKLHKLDERVTKLEDKEAAPKPSCEPCTEDYKAHWDEPLFLETEEPILSRGELYQRPTLAVRGMSAKTMSVDEFLTQIITNKSGNRMYTVLGQPGMGKSTLITYLLNEQAYLEKANDILVYRFSELKIDWRSNGLFRKILKYIEKIEQDLSNKILILDGYDEISVSDGREDILNSLWRGCCGSNKMKNFTLLVTSRESAVQNPESLHCNYVTLQPLDEEQRKDFCTAYWENKNNVPSEAEQQKFFIALSENKEALGIPLILYMTVAMNISLGTGMSVTDIYDELFKVDGGIYERKEYDKEHPLTSEKKEAIDRATKEIALWMFEHEPEKAEIPRRNYEKIVKDNIAIPIAQFIRFTRQMEAGGTVVFVHRSIYEYFVAKAIFDVLLLDVDDEIWESGWTEMAGKLSDIFQRNQLRRKDAMTQNIVVHLERMIQKRCAKISSKDKKKEIISRWREMFDELLKNGMRFYATKPRERFWDEMQKEMYCFFNDILLLIAILESCGEKAPHRIGDVEKSSSYFINSDSSFIRYVNHGGIDCFVDLNRVDLRRADLHRAYLHGAYLRGGNLRRADLGRADLGGADLGGIDLRDAYLSGANLSGANLSGVNLSDADLSEANLSGVDLSGANLSDADLRGADLSGARLSGADLRRANLLKVGLHRTRLYDAELKGTELYIEDLKGAIYRRKDIKDVNFQDKDKKAVRDFLESVRWRDRQAEQ